MTRLVLAEHGHDRARLQGELVGPAVVFLKGDDGLAGNSELATRAMSIAGGTSEITRNQIAERILGFATRSSGLLATWWARCQEAATSCHNVARSYESAARGSGLGSLHWCWQYSSSPSWC